MIITNTTQIRQRQGTEMHLPQSVQRPSQNRNLAVPYLRAQSVPMERSAAVDNAIQGEENHHHQRYSAVENDILCEQNLSYEML